MWMEPILRIENDRAIFAISGWVFAFIMSFAFFFVSAPPIPEKDGCALYRVDKQPVTAYVLKPPPAEIRYEACPQTTEKLNALELSPIVQPKPEEPAVEEEKPREHRRRHRYRRYWR